MNDLRAAIKAGMDECPGGDLYFGESDQIDAIEAALLDAFKQQTLTTWMNGDCSITQRFLLVPTAEPVQHNPMAASLSSCTVKGSTTDPQALGWRGRVIS